MSKASWFLSYLSGQLSDEALQDDTILEQLTGIEFEADDADDLWSHPQVQQAYAGDGGKPDRKLFEKEYASAMDTFKRYELGKTVDRYTPKFEEGGQLPDGGKAAPLGPRASPDSQLRGITHIDYDKAASAAYIGSMGKDVYQTYNVGMHGAKFSLLDHYTPEEIAFDKGTVYDPKEDDVREYTFWDRIGATKVVQNHVTGEFEMAKLDDGEDVSRTMAEGSNFGMIGVFGPQRKHSGRQFNGIIGTAWDTATATSEYLLGHSYNTLMGIGKGTIEATMASNGLMQIGSQDQLENISSWFVSQAYQPAESIEAGGLKSVEGFFNGSLSAVAQVATAIGASYALSRAGMRGPAIQNTIAGALTLYGANEMYHNARNMGLNDRSAALIYGGSLLALYGTNKLTPYLTKPFQKDATRELARKVYKEALDPKTVAALESGLIKEDAVIKSIWGKMYDGAKKMASGELVHNMGEEALQESLETTVEFGSKYISHHLGKMEEAYGIKLGHEDALAKRLFNEDLTLSNYGSAVFESAVFGSIGGAGGHAAHKILGGKDNDNVPDLLHFLSQTGKGDFNENYKTMRSVLEEDYKKGQLASTKIGYHKASKKMDVITPKNAEHMLSLNDFFYRMQLSDLEAAKSAWSESGLNDVRNVWEKLNEGMDFEKDFKLTPLQKAFIQRKVQAEATWTLHNLWSLDTHIAEVKSKREATGSTDDADSFKRIMFGTKGAPAAKGDTAKKKKAKKGGKKKDGEDTVDTGYVPKRPEEGKIMREQGLAGLRQFYLDRIEDLRTGQRMDEMYRDVLIDTAVANVREEDGALRYEMASAGLKPKTYHDPKQQLDNLNLSLIYSVENELARITQENKEAQTAYAEALKKAHGYNWGVDTLPEFSDLAANTDLNKYRADFNLALGEMLSAGLNDTEKGSMQSLSDAMFDKLIHQAETLKQDHENAGDDYEAQIAAEHALTLQNMKAEAAQRINDAAPVLVQELDDRNWMADQLYLKDLEELDYKSGKSTRYDMVSGENFLQDLLAQQEALEEKLKEDYTETAVLQRMLRDVNARIAQVRLNAGANRKANNFRTQVLEELVDSDGELSTVERILQRKRERQREKGMQGPEALTQQRPSADFTQLSEEEGKRLEGILLDMRDRASKLLSKAERNQPDYDSVRKREDVRHLFSKAQHVRALVNLGPSEPASLSWAETAWKDEVLRRIARIEAMASSMFDGGVVPSEPTGKVNNKATKEALLEMHELSLQVDWDVHDLLRNKPDGRIWLELQRPKSPKQKGASNLQETPESRQHEANYNYLVSMHGINPFEFQDAFLDVIESEDKGGMPSIVQQDMARFAVGFLLDNPVEDYYFGGEDLSVLMDQVFVTGVQGSGKTTQVAKVAISVWERLTADTERINPQAMDQWFRDFVSTNNGQVVQPYMDGGRSVYAQYKGNDPVPVTRAVKPILESEVKAWHPAYADAEIIELSHSAAPKKVNRIEGGNLFYITESGGKKKIYVIGNSVSFGSGNTYAAAKDVTLIRHRTVEGRVLALSRSQRQGAKLGDLLGPSAETLPESTGDNQTEALIALLEDAVTNDTALPHDLIVYDEATLIPYEKLKEINRLLRAYNEAGLWRKPEALRPKPLRIMYLGDPMQVGENRGLRGMVTPRVEQNPVTGKDMIVEGKSHDLFVPRTPEMLFSFRSGVKDIYETVDLFRNDRYNTDLLPAGQWLGFQTRFHVGPKGARGVQMVPPSQRDGAVRKLLASLSEAERKKIAYILPALPEHELTALKDSFSAAYGLPTSQFYSVMEAQGLDFEYTINDYEHGVGHDHLGNEQPATFASINGIVSAGLKYTAVSGIGRSKQFALFVMSGDTREMSSKRVKSIREVEYFKEIKSPDKKAREAYANDLREMLGRNSSRRQTSQPNAQPQPQPTTSTGASWSDSVLDVPWLQNRLSHMPVQVEEDVDAAGNPIVRVHLTNADGTIRLGSFDVPFVSNNTVVQSIKLAKADPNTGQTGVKAGFSVGGQLFNKPSAYTNFDELILRDDASSFDGTFIKRRADGSFKIQHLQHIVQHGENSYLVPMDATSPEDLTVLSNDAANWPKLEDAGVGFLGVGGGYNYSFAFYMPDPNDPSAPGTVEMMRVVFDPTTGKYSVPTPTGMQDIQDTFTLQDIENLLCPVA